MNKKQSLLHLQISIFECKNSTLFQHRRSWSRKKMYLCAAKCGTMREESNTGDQSPEAAKKGCLALLAVLVALFLIGRNCSHNAEEKEVAPAPAASPTEPAPPSNTSLSDTLKVSTPKTPAAENRSQFSPLEASCEEGYADGYENGYASGQRGHYYDHGYYYGDGSNTDPAAVAKYRECYDEGYQDGYYDGQAEYSAEQERLREEEERQRELYRFP